MTADNGKSLLVCVAVLIVASACAAARRSGSESAYLDAFDDGGAPVGEYAEGEIFDALISPDDLLRLIPKSKGAVPPPPAALKAPAIVVSLDGLTCRLFDAEGTFERVYPIGVGVRSAATGESITPVGRFRTHPDATDRFFYMWERRVPEYFDGLPFLRLSVTNRRGSMTYGLHGPITAPLKRGYVSHGCVRMRPDDIQEVFTIAYAHPGMPVVIQKAADVRRSGERVDTEYPRYRATSSAAHVT